MASNIDANTNSSNSNKKQHEDKLITSAAVKRVLREYTNEYKKYPLHAALSLLLPAIGTIFVAYIPPLIISRIIDTFAKNANSSLAEVYLYIFAFGGVWLLGEAFL